MSLVPSDAMEIPTYVMSSHTKPGGAQRENNLSTAPCNKNHAAINRRRPPGTGTPLFATSLLLHVHPLAECTSAPRCCHDEKKASAHFSRCISKEFKAHKSKVHSVAWNCAGNFLASGSVDKTARLWTPERGVNSMELKGHTDSVDQLVWNPTHADMLATASSDRTVRIWDARSAGKSTTTVQTSGENINICWSPDGNHIAVGNKDDAIQYIDTRVWRIENTHKYEFEVNEITWNHSGDLFFVTTSGGQVRILEYPSMRELHTLEAHTSSCYCVEVDPVARYLAVGSADALVSLWDMDEWVCVRTFGKLDFPVRTISFSYDGDYLASGSEDLAIDISHVETGESVFSIRTSAAINTLAWHPHRYLLAFAGDEQKVGGGEFLGNLRVFGFHGGAGR